MANLGKTFKTREEICLWLEKHQAALEDQIGFRLNIISVCDKGAIKNFIAFSSFVRLARFPSCVGE